MGRASKNFQCPTAKLSFFSLPLTMNSCLFFITWMHGRKKCWKCISNADMINERGQRVRCGAPGLWWSISWYGFLVLAFDDCVYVKCTSFVALKNGRGWKGMLRAQVLILLVQVLSGIPSVGNDRVQGDRHPKSSTGPRVFVLFVPYLPRQPSGRAEISRKLFPASLPLVLSGMELSPLLTPGNEMKTFIIFLMITLDLWKQKLALKSGYLFDTL